jgi:TatD DNase family protein
MIDTHAHIYLNAFDDDRKDVVERAKSVGVELLFMPNIDLSSIEQMKTTAKTFPGFVKLMMGLHPSSVKADWQNNLAEIKKELTENIKDYIAIGEIGIDLYWDKTFLTEQVEVFCQQCQWAVENSLPVVIHSRSAHNEILQALDSLKVMPKGVFHCFSGNVKEANQILDMGFYLGIGGVVTFKNSQLREVLINVPLERIVLETDSPYLAPHPFRGKRNEPAYLNKVVETLSQIYSVSFEQIMEITKTNTKQLFSI